MKATKKNIRKYVANLFGKDINVVFQHHFRGGYSAMAFRPLKRIRLSTCAFIGGELDNWKKHVIWHEVGHIRAGASEREAELWALGSMKKRGYRRLLAFSLGEMIKWQLWRGDSTHDKYYQVAKEIVQIKL